LEGLALADAEKCSRAAAAAESAYSPAGSGADVGYVDAAALVFDWCYDLLDNSDKVELIGKIRLLRNEHKNNSTTGVRGFFRWHETFLKSSFAYVASVLAIEGEPGVSSELREAQNVLQNLQELGDEVAGDGGYQDYFYQGSFQILPFLMWSSATDRDFALDSKFTQNFTKWATYKLSPTREGFLRGPGDDHAFESAYTKGMISAGGFYLLASYLGDPVAQWLGGVLEENFDQDRHWPTRGPSFLSLIHFDPERPAQSPSDAGFPLSALFETSGMVHTRSSWSADSDTVHSWFFNGPATGHSGESQNHFVIWRGDDPLILQGGGYLGSPSTYHSHYYLPTVSDNSVLFSPIAAGSPDHDGGQSSEYSSTELNEEHYPVAERVGSYSGQHRYRGEVVHFQESGQYLVASGDASAAYNPDHVNVYIRDFVYLRPDVFLIRDRYEATGVATVRSLIHSRSRPIHDGDETIVQGGANAGIVETDAGAFRLHRGSSFADIDVVWPTDHRLRFVGGSGWEGYADGYNPDPWSDCQDWLKGHWQLPERIKLIEGQWRTEIEVSDPSSETDLVYAIFVSGSEKSLPKPTYSVKNHEDGLVLTVNHYRRTWIVIFPANGPPRVVAGRRASDGRRIAPLAERSKLSNSLGESSDSSVPGIELEGPRVQRH
jgi:hypothetical protein